MDVPHAEARIVLLGRRQDERVLVPAELAHVRSELLVELLLLARAHADVLEPEQALADADGVPARDDTVLPTHRLAVQQDRPAAALGRDEEPGRARPPAQPRVHAADPVLVPVGAAEEQVDAAPGQPAPAAADAPAAAGQRGELPQRQREAVGRAVAVVPADEPAVVRGVRVVQRGLDCAAGGLVQGNEVGEVAEHDCLSGDDLELD